MVLERIDAYLIKVFGFKMATLLKTDCAKKSDLIKVILLKELNRTYKYADAAYQALDFKGKGHIEVADLTEAKFVYRLPISKDVRIYHHYLVKELESYLRENTIFKKTSKLK